VAGLDLTTDRVAGVAAVRARFADRAAVLVETTMLRARAQVKLPGTGTWLFTDDALQQATAAPVAAHRARRLTGQRVHDATCSIGTELAALHAHGVWALGSDIDDVRLSMAQHNLDGRVPLCRADALAPVSRDTVVLLDPARRSAGVRRFDPRAYTPPLDDIATVYAGRPIIVKCAPGIDFDAVRALGFDGEIEVVSLGGSVREACLWPAVLCEPGVRRRAVVLSRGEQFTDADPDDCPVAPAGRWIVEPDGAVVRAGLVRQYATRFGLWQLDPDIAYLSGPQLPEGVRGFEVLEEMVLHEKRLRAALIARDCGALEILVRGVGVDPDVLRRRIRPRGMVPLTVVISRIGTGAAARAVAYICRASR